MKGIILIAFLFAAHGLWARQQDSTDIKLQQYKTYFDKDLINQQDYDLLKAKLLHIGKFAPNRHGEVTEGIKQYNKRITFGIRVEPVAFFDLRSVSNQPYFNSAGQVQSYKQVMLPQQYGGAQIGIGAAIKKQYHIHFIMGFDGNQQQQFLTLGADFNVNFLPGSISPFIHVGGGYAGLGGNSQNSIVSDDRTPPINGGYAVSGIGLYARLTGFFALNISPDYRFIYNSFTQEVGAYNGAPVQYGTARIFYHQIGLRIAAVFY